LLPKIDKTTRSHHAALPHELIPEFMSDLRQREGVGALALEFLILTAARTIEVIGATWPEIDLKECVWTIPANRMKAKREHRIPLAKRALEILNIMAERTAGPYVFPGARSGREMSNMTLEAALRRMGRANVTAHGMRSSFRDWAGDETNHERETAEAALAHILGDKAERAYRRKDALKKRRALMQDWDRYCASKASGRAANRS